MARGGVADQLYLQASEENKEHVFGNKPPKEIHYGDTPALLPQTPLKTERTPTREGAPRKDLKINGRSAEQVNTKETRQGAHPTRNRTRRPEPPRQGGPVLGNRHSHRRH